MRDVDLIRRWDVMEILFDEGWYGNTLTRIEHLSASPALQEARDKIASLEAMLTTARADALREAAEEELIRELVRRNGITDGPKSRTPHKYEVLLGIGVGNHCYLTFTDRSDVEALIPEAKQ